MPELDRQEMLRLFVALTIDSAVRNDLSAMVDSLKKRYPRASQEYVRWVDPSLMHMTLAFLGYRVPEDAAALQAQDSVLATAASALEAPSSFSMELHGGGTFMDAHGNGEARILFVKPAAGVDQVLSLGRAVRGALAEVGFKNDTELKTPHVTLGYIKHPTNSIPRAELGQLVQAVQAWRFKPPLLQYVSKLVLMKSDRSQTGAVYTQLSEFPLKR